MKKLLFTVFAACALGITTDAQEMNAEEMKAWKDYMTPGKVHKMMAGGNGEWTNEITMWMDPSHPTKSIAKSTNKMLLGGRYQQSNFTGTMMGEPFEGISTTGYDNKTQTFTNMWLDNMGTGTMILKGKWDEATKSITFAGSIIDPMSGNEMPVRQILTYVDGDHETMVMYQTMNGTEMKMMEIKSARVKKK